jgi:hypothetical protein
MPTFLLPGLLRVLGALTTLAAALGRLGLVGDARLQIALLLVGVYDVVQRRHWILRNHPVLGHLRFPLEDVRPELQQYFIARNGTAAPTTATPAPRSTSEPRTSRRSSLSAPTATSPSRALSSSSTPPNRGHPPSDVPGC